MKKIIVQSINYLNRWTFQYELFLNSQIYKHFLFLGLLRFSEYGGLGSDVDPAPTSVWSGFFKKMLKLLPYMWPSRSPFLQLRVLFCIVLLAGIRSYINILYI